MFFVFLSRSIINKMKLLFIDVYNCEFISIRDIKRDLNKHVNAWINDEWWLNSWLVKWFINVHDCETRDMLITCDMISWFNITI